MYQEDDIQRENNQAQDSQPKRDQQSEKRKSSIVIKTSNVWLDRTPGIMMILLGGLFTICSIGLGSLLLIQAIVGSNLTGSISTFIGTMFIIAIIAIACIAYGSKKNSRISRFKQYLKILSLKGFCDLKILSNKTGLALKIIKKDLHYMCKKRWFLEGYFDQKETCFMATKENYDQYLKVQKDFVQRCEEIEQEKEPLKDNEHKENEPNYVQEIREVNSRIPDQIITQKLNRLELVIAKITEFTEERQEKQSEVRKFFSYYLPMTLKLVKKYYELNELPLQGENIKKSKEEIEKTIDLINEAFEKMFDELYQEDMLDITSDISVLSSMLAGEGLIGNQFQREVKGEI